MSDSALLLILCLKISVLEIKFVSFLFFVTLLVFHSVVRVGYIDAICLVNCWRLKIIPSHLTHFLPFLFASSVE